MINHTDVEKMLSELDIPQDGTIVIHTSLKSIGEIEGRAEGLLDSYIKYLSDGLLVIPTHTWAVVNRSSPIFDVRSSIPNIGAFPKLCAREAFLRENAVRSLHPTHSVAVFGKRCREFVAGEELTRTRTPRNGVWGRLYDERARVLMIGIGLERNTYMHTIDEDVNEFPDDPSLYFDATVLDESGNKISVPHMNTEFYWSSEDFPLLEGYFRRNGVMSYSRLGNAEVKCFDVRKGRDLMLELCKKAADPRDFMSIAEAAKQS